MDRDEWLRIHKELRFWGLLGWGLGLPGACLAMMGLLSSFVTVAPPARQAHEVIVALQLFAGLALFCGGLAAYARHRGLSAAWGLMGLSCLLGLLVIRFMPKRCRGCERACAGGSFDCPGCGAPL